MNFDSGAALPLNALSMQRSRAAGSTIYWISEAELCGMSATCRFNNLMPEMWMPAWTNSPNWSGTSDRAIASWAAMSPTAMAGSVLKDQAASHWVMVASI